MPAPFVAVLCAALAALLTAAVTPPVLRSLPEPVDPDGKLPYTLLATPGVAITVGSASLAASLVVTLTLPWQHWLAWSALSLVGVLACTVDAHTTWLPLPLARAGWAVATLGVVTLALASGTVMPARAAGAGAVAVGGVFHLLWRVTGAFGYGDVRLAATIGAVTALDSATLVAWSLLLGTVAGASIGVAHRLAGGRGAFPYGPGLLAGPFLALAARAAFNGPGLSWPGTG